MTTLVYTFSLFDEIKTCEGLVKQIILPNFFSVLRRCYEVEVLTNSHPESESLNT